jgi:DNA-directed RNA polymerase subunit K/omega
MQVFTPIDVARNASNKYLAVLVAAQYARALNEFPRMGSTGREKKLTTRALEELTNGNFQFRIVPRRRGAGAPASSNE